MTDDDAPFWPARHIAEVAYCPRLFYLAEVEGIDLVSHDTEQGQAVHRRVDEPSHKAPPDPAAEADPDRPAAIRSITLSSETHRLTATLDLAEITGQQAIPVEYRKGRPSRPRTPMPDGTERLPAPADQPEPWPTDRVQLTLQAILLEEAGYSVPYGILYYAAERRRLTLPITPELRQEALGALAQAKALAAAGVRPPPLVNDPRCPRCSLQPFCLPDEINFEKAGGPNAPEEFSPRRILPRRDDGIHLVSTTDGIKIGVSGASLRFTDKEGRLVRESPLADVESLSVLGYVQVTTQALHALSAQDIPVAWLTAGGRLVAMLDPLSPTSAAVRRAQVRRFDDPAQALRLARALIAAKITNQRTLLMRNHPDIPPTVPRDLADAVTRANEAESIDSLRGIEGAAAALYFHHFPALLPAEQAAAFATNGRQRRPPPDPVNSVLSFAYTMLCHECVAALRLASLEPTIGAYHTTRPGRPALALDLMEPFRPLIADSVAISAFNRGEFSPGHFNQTAAGCLMTDHGRRAFFSALGRRMETEITHPVFDYRLSYRRMIVLHARMIAAWLLGEIDTLHFLTTR